MTLPLLLVNFPPPPPSPHTHNGISNATGILLLSSCVHMHKGTPTHYYNMQIYFKATVYSVFTHYDIKYIFNIWEKYFYEYLFNTYTAMCAVWSGVPHLADKPGFKSQASNLTKQETGEGMTLLKYLQIH